MYLAPTDGFSRQYWEVSRSLPHPMPVELYVPPGRTSSRFQPMHMALGLLVNGYVDNDGYEHLKRGQFAVEMEDKWNNYMEEVGTVHFHRSWTGVEIFRFAMQNRDDRHFIEIINREGDAGIYSPASEAAVLDEFLLILAGMGVFLMAE